MFGESDGTSSIGALAAIVGLCVGGVFCFGAACAGDEPLRRIAECGVESFELTSRPECGAELYREARSDYCPVELYMQSANFICGKHQEGETCTRVCADPSFLGATFRTFSALRPGSGGHACHNECTPNWAPDTCRKPEFGVELRANCRAPQHGVERNASCADPLRPIFRECSAKTRNEIDAFVAAVETQIDVSGALLLTHNANLFKFDNSAIALACFIKRWDGDPVVQGVVDDMKQQFPMLTGDAYVSSLAENCDLSMSVNEIAGRCADKTDTAVCKTFKAYSVNKRWLETQQAAANNFMSEPAVMAEANLGQTLANIAQRISEYLK